MPFVANTPEALLGRSDSRNPNATCRGITASGRPCRRPIAASPSSGLLPSLHAAPDPRDENLYCWQHKEQASLSARSSPGPRGTATPILEHKSSIDTLADRLGLVDLQDKRKPARNEKQGQNRPRPPRPSRTSQSKKHASRLQLCCFSVPLEEETKPTRPQPRPIQHQATSTVPAQVQRPKPQPVAQSPYKQRLGASHASPSKSSYRSRKSTASQTAQLKDLIPDALDTTTASALMTELARPYVDSEESGFIYMFWLTPASGSSSPPIAAARDLLAPPSTRPPRTRRPSDVVSRFADQSSTGHKTMMLKIGRAANVQRRMNQWQRQCGYDIEVLRFYPYVPGASDTSSGAVPRMTPHCKRVERLIHIELAGMGLRAAAEACGTCGREHREWFEVDASRAGIRRVDDVVRRWVDWDETNV
ncbi:hypothetical protein S40288_01536 [Stachybotrys chartarum IBT 40288]|nr:hypothetical protein S40288_01536 [Stachybotrys chartarum IBT 40288]